MDIYGVIGYPIKHSLSPAMHNSAFKALGISAEYNLFEIRPEELEDFLLNRKEVIGFNITIPHKVRTREVLLNSGNLIERQSDIRYIEFSGAINTVKRVGEKFLCTNTDISGFIRSLEQDLGCERSGKNVLLAGCGGAGRAVIAGLSCGATKCKKIYIYDNNPSAVESARRSFIRFSDLKNRLEFISREQIPVIIKDCQLLVNATPIGMKEGVPSVIDKDLLHKELCVYDVVYNRETQLVKDAKSVGCKAVGGLGMLLYQGVRAFEFWTGRKAPIDVMKKALDKALKLQGNV